MRPRLQAEVLFIPLLAAWAIWIGLAISTKVTETWVAQQLPSWAAWARWRSSR